MPTTNDTQHKANASAIKINPKMRRKRRRANVRSNSLTRYDGEMRRLDATITPTLPVAIHSRICTAHRSRSDPVTTIEIHNAILTAGQIERINSTTRILDAHSGRSVDLLSKIEFSIE